MRPLVLIATSRPKLRRGIRVRYDRRSGQYVLLTPERGLTLNQSAAGIVQRCTGELNLDEITSELLREWGDLDVPLGEVQAQVRQFLCRLAQRRLITVDTDP